MKVGRIEFGPAGPPSLDVARKQLEQAIAAAPSTATAEALAVVQARIQRLEESALLVIEQAREALRTRERVAEALVACETWLSRRGRP